MFAKRTIYFIVSLAFFAASIQIQRGYSQVTEQRIVRIAELEIDPNQLTAYKTALKEEIETSISVEPGVLALYAVSVKDHPNQIRLFESYGSLSAYALHVELDATNVQSGVLTASPYLWDYKGVRVSTPKLPLVLAVAAFSVFASIISPCEFDLD